MEPIDYNSCEIFGAAGIFIQITLAALSFSVLIYKRSAQQPRRPWNIWALDTSKQGVSQLIAHFLNVIISIKLSNKMQTCACNWYFTTNILDNVFGVFLALVLLKTVERFILWGKLFRYRSGNYYTTYQEYDYESGSVYQSGIISSSSHNRSFRQIIQPMPLDITVKKTKYIISYTDWTVQLLIWNLIVLGAKSVVFFTEKFLSQPFVAFSDFILRWIEPYETLELVLVIVIIPVIFNGLAFWVQDNFLKKAQKQNTSTETLL